MAKRKRPAEQSPPPEEEPEEQQPPTKKAKFDCPYCEVCPSSKGALTSHIKRKHSEKLEIVCDLCPEKFTTARALGTHKTWTHGAKLDCPHCEHKPKTTRELTAHIKKNHPEQFEEFSTAQNLEKDLGEKYPGEKYPCSSCSKIFDTKKKRTIHVNYHHSYTRNFDCPHCQKSFRDSRARNNHVEKHHSNWDCPHCQKSFRDSRARDKHVDKHHSDKYWDCPHCQSNFSSRSKRDTHIERVHNKKIWDCSRCQSNFPSRSKRDKHVQKHHINKFFEINLRKLRKVSDRVNAPYKNPKRDQPPISQQDPDAGTITRICTIFRWNFVSSNTNLGRRTDRTLALRLHEFAESPDLTILDIIGHPLFTSFRRILPAALFDRLNVRRRSELHERALEFLHRRYIVDLEGQGSDVFKQIQIVGDGNCFYRALAAAQLGNQNFWPVIKNILATMYGTVTGRRGFQIDEALAALRGGDYYELQNWTERSTTRTRYDADLETQLFEGGGYWASHDNAYLFTDAFPSRLLIIYEAEISLRREPEVRVAAVRGDINAPPSQHIHILHDSVTSHYRLLSRMESDHLDALGNMPMLNERRDPLWAQRVFTAEEEPEPTVPETIPDEHRIQLASAAGNRAFAQQQLGDISDDDEEGDGADLDDSTIKKMQFRYPRMVQSDLRQLPKSSWSQSLRLELITMERLGGITAGELNTGRKPFVKFGKSHVIDLSDAVPGETEKERDKREGAIRLLHQLDPKTGKLVGVDPLAEMLAAWESTRYVGADVSSLVPDWPADQGDIMELGVNRRNVLYSDATEDEVLLEDWRPGEFELGESEDAPSDLSFSTLGEEDWSDSDNDTLPRVPVQVIDRWQQVPEDGEELDGIAEVIERHGNTLIVLGRFSDDREQDQIAEHLMASDIVADDWGAMHALHRLTDPTLQAIPNATNRWRIMVNNMSADTAIPLHNGVNVAPEHLQLLNILNQNAALGVNAGRVDVLVRSISGWTVAAETWDLLHQRFPDLRIFLTFALREAFMDDYEDNLAATSNIRWLNNRNISPCGMYYTEPIPLSELAKAEVDDPNADAMAVSILQVFTQERMARRAQVEEEASYYIFARGRDRNGYTV